MRSLQDKEECLSDRQSQGSSDHSSAPKLQHDEPSVSNESVSAQQTPNNAAPEGNDDPALKDSVRIYPPWD